MIPILMAAATAAAFNLTCIGREWSGTDEASRGWMRNQGGKPFTDTYRLNLESGRWCFGACKGTLPIARSNDVDIVMTLESFPDIKSETLVTVSRETGGLVHKIVAGPYSFVRLGTCEPAAFTGFPRKF